MDSWCHQRTMLKLRACASAVPEFERSQIASLSSFSAEVATAFIDAFLALQLCLTSRISSQQFNAHTFLEQGTVFKSSGACNGYRTSDRCQHWSKAVSQRRSWSCLSAPTQSFIRVSGRKSACIALLSQNSPASMIWSASSMTVILCKCCPALPFFNFESYLSA